MYLFKYFTKDSLRSFICIIKRNKLWRRGKARQDMPSPIANGRQKITLNKHEYWTLHLSYQL